MALLEIDNLSKLFDGPAGRVRAVEGASLSVQAGQFIVVRGPSGCGKTTLLLAAGALLHPTGGQVRLDGQDPYAGPPEARSRLRAEKIGFVFQQFHLVGYLTVLENVLAAGLGQPRPGPADHARELLGRLGLQDRASHLPADLSTGERQRTALARALLNRPRLLLADEPTGNLDEGNAAVVLAVLADFAGQGGGVLMATHDQQAPRYADRQLAMVGGKIVEA